eukprot:1922258-Amphidinium_carterae.1
MAIQMIPLPSPLFQDVEDDAPEDCCVEEGHSEDERTFGERIKFHLTRIEHHSQKIRDIMAEGEAAHAS